jgi:WD40 repeat protein
MLAGCGELQMPVGPPGAVEQTGVHAAHRGSWMLPEAKSQDLLYVANSADGASGSGSVSVYNYPQGKLVGNLTGFTDPTSLCIDKSGDIFVANSGGEKVVEYAHGGTTPIETLADDGVPNGCAIDPTTGNLAVTNSCDGPIGSCFPSGSVLIFKRARGTPRVLRDQYGGQMFYCAYDKAGDLFVNSNGSPPSFAELPKSSAKFTRIALTLPKKNVYDPGGLQWVGEYLAVGIADGNAVYQYSLNGSRARLVHTTWLRSIGYGNGTNQFWIEGSTVVAEELSTLQYNGYVKFYAYPGGGKPTKILTKSLNNPFAAAISPAKT